MTSVNQEITASKIVNGRSPVTTEMAFRLARVFGTTPELWVNLQKNFDLWHMEHCSDKWKEATPIETTAAAV